MKFCCADEWSGKHWYRKLGADPVLITLYVVRLGDNDPLSCDDVKMNMSSISHLQPYGLRAIKSPIMHLFSQFSFQT